MTAQIKIAIGSAVAVLMPSLRRHAGTGIKQSTFITGLIRRPRTDGGLGLERKPVLKSSTTFST